LYGAGENRQGSLGDGTKIGRRKFIQIDTEVQAVAAYMRTSYYLKEDGTVFGMGTNYNNEISPQDEREVLSPVKIMTGVKSISAGGSYALFKT